MGALVVDMSRIEQCDEHIYIEQRDTHLFVAQYIH